MKRAAAALVLAAALATPLRAQTEQTRESWQRVDRQDAFATNLGGTRFGLVVAKRK